MRNLHAQNRFRLAAAAVLTLCVVGLAGAAPWIGRPFAGFLVLANGVVASASTGDWPATRGGDIYQHRVVAVAGEPIDDVGRIDSVVRALPVGTPLRWRFSGSDGEFERVIATRRFSLRDFTLLFGVFLLNAAALLGAALAVRAVPSMRDRARAAWPFLVTAACWALSALDLYGPYRLFRLHALCEALLFPTALHMALAFPSGLGPAALRRRLVRAGYGLGGALAVVYQLGLFEPERYVAAHLLATSAAGLSLAALVLSQLWRLAVPSAAASRRLTRTVGLGAVAALLLPIALSVAEAWNGGVSSQNAVGFTTFVFPLSIGWAMAREGLAPGSVARSALRD